MFKKLHKLFFNVQVNRQMLNNKDFDKDLDIEARRIVLEDIEEQSQKIYEEAKSGKRFKMNEHQAMLVAKKLGCKVKNEKYENISHIRFVDGNFIAFNVNGDVVKYSTSWLFNNYDKDWYIVD